MKRNKHALLQRQDSDGGTKKENLLRILKNWATLLAVMAACTLISMLMRHFGAHETNIVMVYLLGILGFSYLTGSYFYSLAVSLLGVLFYNFFFTYPYYTLLAYSPDYPLTFLIMFFVGSFTSMLTIRIRRETLLAEEREERIKSLYQIGRRLLGVKSCENLAEVAGEAFAQQLSASVLVQFMDQAGKVQNRYVAGEDAFSGEIEQNSCLRAYHSANPCGRGTKIYPDAAAYYMPIKSPSAVLGIIGLAQNKQAPLTGAQMEFVDTISAQIAVVLEREMLYKKQEETQIQIQRERLRADMLRAISHDLRTPLTGIMGSASTVMDNYDAVNDEIKKSFLTNIYDEAAWLNEMVENILNMTRFDEGKVRLNLEQEAAEEIVAEAIGHVKKRASGHIIRSHIPAEIVLFEADGVLITQVLVNLLDNAINYTPEGSVITVSLSQTEDTAVFEVSDNGPGILEDDIPHMFERLYTRKSKNYGTRKSFGLGLSLCKSIVEAHGGQISIISPSPQGTSVIFSIPKKGGLNECSL